MAHFPSMQTPVSTDSALDPLSIRRDDQYGGPFLQCTAGQTLQMRKKDFFSSGNR